MAAGQRADGPSCRQASHHADQGQAQAGRACARGRHGTWRASPALLAARVPPTLRRVGGGALRTGLQLGRGGFGVGGGCPFGIPELAAGTMGGAGAHDPWATAKHASGVRRARTPEGRAPPILDLRRAKSTVESRMLDRTLRSSGQGKGRLRAHKEVPMSTGQLAMLAHMLPEEGRGRHVQPHPHHHA